jgi:hypothetical protein
MAVALRYLTLSADYQRVAMRDASSGEVDLATLGLPDDLLAELVAWNERYQPIVPADVRDRNAEPLASLIGELDETGRDLAARVEAAIADPAKVAYYSEGLLRPLS